MPLLGKIVVIKRNGTDGTDFPLTASCLFGRKLDCDIRIQLPQVSKEHCRIDLNENKELILTNLSSVNPTRINGEILQQSERLKHGDLITIIDRSFRFEYPPAPTPKKKRLSTPGKGETVKVLQDQQIKSTPGTTEKKKTEHITETYLKDGSNLPSCLDQSVRDEQNKSTDGTLSPFFDLYDMVKRDLATKPWKSSSLSNTPLSRPPADNQDLEKVYSENEKPATPKSSQKKRRSSTAKLVDGNQMENVAQVRTATPAVREEQKRRSEGTGTPGSQKKALQTTPQKFTADQVAQQIAFESPSAKSPKGRRSSSGGARQTPASQTSSQSPSEPEGGEEDKVAEAKQATRTSPRASAGKRLQVQDVLQEVLVTPMCLDEADNDQASSKKHKCDDLPLPAPKRKRVSFGGQLSPELFDKRLPPNSPLRRGATPGRRSLGFSQKSHSLLRRASTIGLMGYKLKENIAESPAKNASPKRAASPAKALKTPSPAKALKTPSPAKALKTPSPAKALKTPSPAKALKTPSPAKALKTPSPAKALKTPSPAKALKTPSPAKALKTPSPAKALKTPSPAKALKTPSPAKALKTPSPAKALKTPSPAKALPSPKAKTPSPKIPKAPSPSSNPSTPKSSRRLSNASVKSPSPSQESLLKTPSTHGRFSVSRISTPSPVSDQEKGTKESMHGVKESQECVTPRAMPRRKSMKASARKTPKSVLKSALDVVRSRRSGASRANLKVVSSWADIVKFGQIKPQTEGGATKAITKKAAAVKQSKVTKPKTPAHRLKENTSTGHADSPASIVVGKAYLRSTQLVGAAPKVVCNVALFKKDMKMDEDLTGVSDIFKTPANNRRKSAYTKANECPVTPHGVTEMSVMNTPEESGEMVVSPISVVSTTKLGRYNSEAVNRLLQVDQDGSLIEAMDTSAALSQSEVSTVLHMPSEDQTQNKNSGPVQTPRHKPTLPECLTGVKRLLRTPKQKAEPVEDLRGKLLKTPKAPKLSQEESLEGVKELLSTPKQRESPLEKGRAGVKRSTTSPKVTNSPVVCSVSLKRLDKIPNDMAEQEEDLTGVKRLMKTPKLKKQVVEEDLTGVKQMMKTPRQKKQPVAEDLTGVKQMMKTPRQKKQPVAEDLTGVKQMMKTPKLRNQPVEEDLTGVKELMKTPMLKNQPVEDLPGVKQIITTSRQKEQQVEEDLTGVKEMMKTPKLKNHPVEEDLSGVRHLMKTPKQKKQPVEEDLTGVQQIMKTPKQKNYPVKEDLTGVKQLMKTPKQKNQPVEDDIGIDRLMKTPKQKRESAVFASTIVAELGSEVLPVRGVREESEEKENIGPVEDLTNAKAAVILQIETEEAVTACPEVQEAPLKTTRAAVEATISVASPKHEQKTSSPAKKSQCGVRTAQKSQKNQHEVDSDSLSAGTEDETSVKSAPSVRGRRGKSVNELIQDVSIQSPARKSTRGKIPKEQVEALQSSAEDEQVVLKARRGRKAEQEVEVKQVGPVNDVKASVEMEILKSPAPVKAKKGRKEKPELETLQEPEALPEASGEEIGVASERDELLPSAESEVAPVKSNTKARKGRTTRKEPTQSSEVEEFPDVVAEVEGAALESSKAENDNSVRKTRRGRPTKKESPKPTLTAVESEVKSSDAVVELAVEAEPKLPENAEVHSAAETEDSKANLKPRRGRATKKETSITFSEEPSKSASDSKVLPEEHLHVPVLKSRRGRRVNPVDLSNQVLADESNIESCVEPQPKPEAPPVRSSRGARNKQMKLQVEDAADGPATETVAMSSVTEEPAEEAVVKTVRGLGRTKQPKVQVEAKTSIESETIQHLEAPTARSSRGRRTAAVKDEPEPPIKRGRRGATVEIPPPVVKPTRGRKAVAKSEQVGVSEDATAVVEPGEEPGTRTKVQESTMSEASLVQAASDRVDVSSEVAAKRGKGKIAKKAKVSFKDTVTEAVEEEPSNKKEQKPAAKNNDPSNVETKQSEHPIVKGRKGKGAKKTEEPEMEKPALEENIRPARRGRTGASVVPQHDEVATSQKRGQKRKEMEVVVEETPDMESLPKRKRGKGAGTEAQTGAATPGRGRRTGAKEAQGTSVVEKPLRKDEKPVRGRRKPTEEDVPAQTEDPVSEVTARRGTRGQKKAETDVPLAPERRTRRK